MNQIKSVPKIYAGYPCDNCKYFDSQMIQCTAHNQEQLPPDLPAACPMRFNNNTR